MYEGESQGPATHGIVEGHACPSNGRRGYTSSHHIKAARGFVQHMGKEHDVTVMRRRHLPMCLYSPLGVDVLQRRILTKIKVRHGPRHTHQSKSVCGFVSSKF